MSQGEDMLPNLLSRRWTAIILFAMVMILNVPTAFSQSATFTNISFEEFSGWLEDKDFLLVNVHVPYQGEIPGTDLLISYRDVEDQKDRLPKSKDTKIVVYCLTGPMGYQASASLVKLGYTRVYHFEGGMLTWVRSGRKLIYPGPR